MNGQQMIARLHDDDHEVFHRAPPAAPRGGIPERSGPAEPDPSPDELAEIVRLLEAEEDDYFQDEENWLGWT